MKKLIFVVLLIVIAFGVYRFLYDSPTPLSGIVAQNTISGAPDNPVSDSEVRTSVFVPYWTLTADTSVDEYDTLIYFGVTPAESGLNTDDAGYAGIEAFQAKAVGKDTYLTVRMLDSKQNFSILENTVLQHTLITQTVSLAKKQGFDGVVLDLEVSALPFASVIDQISAFNKSFYTATKAENLHYSVLIYGDTFFRIRPFDVKSLGQNSDEVIIMAYDFHKSRGNPGPNFPLSGREKYGYDYSRLIDQYIDAVPREKLTVAFGLFGYDWEVDRENNKISHGEPLSYNQINDRFLSNCQFKECSVKRDSISTESFVTYTDEEGSNHTVWFEDLDSVAKKREFLQTKGIASYSYWAYSYF